jgi:hypothetical protein
MLPPAVRAAIIARIVALTPTTTGATAYSGSLVGLDGIVWAECETPLTPANLPSTLEYLRAWVELGDGRDIQTLPLEPTTLIQEVAIVWVYPCRSVSEAEKVDFDRAWYSMAALYLHLLATAWAEPSFVVERPPGVALARPQRVDEKGRLLCEIRIQVQYSLEA